MACFNVSLIVELALLSPKPPKGKVLRKHILNVWFDLPKSSVGEHKVVEETCIEAC